MVPRQASHGELSSVHSARALNKHHVAEAVRRIRPLDAERTLWHDIEVGGDVHTRLNLHLVEHIAVMRHLRRSILFSVNHKSEVRVVGLQFQHVGGSGADSEPRGIVRLSVVVRPHAVGQGAVIIFPSSVVVGVH